MAASPPPQARSVGGDGPVSLFVDTDLGTRLALPVAADSTIRHLKSQVAVEHATVFPDFGPVAVKSFQVRRKGAMYYLSDSMIVRSAFTKVKAGCFLHVKMAAAMTDTNCCRDALAMEDRGRSSEGCLGLDMDKRVRELPAMISEIPSAALPQGLGVTKDVLLTSLSQQNTEREKNEAVEAISVPVNPTSVANVERSTNQSNISLVGEELHTRKEDTLHCNGDHDEGVVPGNKEARIEEVLKEPDASDDLSQVKEHKKARKAGSFGTSTAGPIRETNELGNRDVAKSDQAPLEANINSSQQKVHRDIYLQEDSTQQENPSIDGKSKKRKKRQPVTSKEVVSAQEMAKPSTGAVEVSKVIGEVALHKDNQGLHGEGAYNVELICRDKTMVRQSDMPLSSPLFDNGSHGVNVVQLLSNDLATSDLVADQVNIECTIGDTVNPTSEVVADEKKITKEGNAPWDDREKHVRNKQPIDDDGGHDEVVETSNMEKASKGKNILEKIHKAGNTSQEKKRKKEKRVCCVDITSMDTAGEKDQCEYEKDATKSDTAPTQEEIAIGPSKQRISSNVPQGDSNVMENISVDGKRKKKRHRSESSKGIDLTQDVAKSSGVTTNESSMQNTNADFLDAKQKAPDTTREETIGDHKSFDGSLDKATKDVIDEVLADLRSTDSLNKDLNGDMLAEQTRLDSNQIVPGLLGNSGDTGGFSAALPPKYPVALNSDAPISSPGHKKSKRRRLKVKATMLGSSCSSGGAPEENDITKIRETDKNSDLEGIVTENNVAQADDKTKATKRQRKKVSLKHAPTDIGDAIQSLGDQNNHAGGQLKVMTAMLGSSCSIGGAPDRNDNTEKRESEKNPDHEGIVTENGVKQADDKTKASKRQRKKISSKHVPTDNGETIQSLGDQDNHAAPEHLKEANTTEAELVQGVPVIDNCASTVGKEQEKSKRSSEKRTPRIQEMNNSAHGQDSNFAIDSQDKYTIDIDGIHDNENMVGPPTESPVVQKDATTLKSTRRSARKGMKKSSKAEPHSQDFALGQGFNADLINSQTEKAIVSPKCSAGALEPNNCLVANPVNDNINFLEHFKPGKMNATSVSAENKENGEDETTKEVEDKKMKRKPDLQSQCAGSIHLHTDRTSLTDHCGPVNVGVPSVSAEEMNREDETVKKVKEKKKSKRKSNSVMSVSDQDHPCGDHQQSDNCTNELLCPVVQKGITKQDSRKEINEKVTQNDSLLKQETEDGTHKLHQTKFSAVSQNNLPLDKDHTHMSKEQRKYTLQRKHHVGPINERTGQNSNAVSNLVKSFSMSPPPSSESTESTQQNANRYRVAVRKVSRKKYEQICGRSKKDASKRDISAIFNDAISEGSDDALSSISEKAAMEASPDDSSTSADSGVSSAAHDGSDVPEDDGFVPLSQKSLQGLHIGSILRSSSSYKKARRKQTEQMDDTEVPDSQPVDGL